MEEHGYCVYKHTSPCGKVYIGITGAEPEKRWRGGYGYQNNKHFWSAIQKYGWDSFQHEVLFDGLTKEAACAIEVRLIAECRSADPTKGYNQSMGGEHGTHSAASREKMSVSHRGVPLSAEHRARIGDGSRGRKMSKKLRVIFQECNRARVWQPESLEKLREHHAGGPKGKPIQCVETGIVYAGIQAASRETGITASLLCNCCKGKKNYNTAGGFHWRYYDGEL